MAGKQTTGARRGSYAILQFDELGHPLPKFGEPRVQALLDEAKLSKQRWDTRRTQALYVGLGLLLSAVAALSLGSTQRRKTLTDAHVLPGAFTVNCANASRWNGVWSIALYSPILVMLFFIVMPLIAPSMLPSWWIEWRSEHRQMRWQISFAVGLIYLLYGNLISFLMRNSVRWESVANRQALRLLNAPALKSQLMENEVALVVLVVHGIPTKWWVATNRRLLLFKVKFFEVNWSREIAYSQVQEVGLIGWKKASATDKLAMACFACTDKLRLVPVEGSAIEGFVNSNVTAQRMLQLVQSCGDSGLLPKGVSDASNIEVPDRTKAIGSLPMQVVASALIPGLGQWMQRRPVSAIVEFLIFATYSLYVSVPLFWKAYYVQTEIQAASLVNVLVWHLCMAAFSAVECWIMRRR